jgi:hypothetical protein
MFLWTDDEAPEDLTPPYPDELRWAAVYLSIVLLPGVVPVLAACCGGSARDGARTGATGPLAVSANEDLETPIKTDKENEAR